MKSYTARRASASHGCRPDVLDSRIARRLEIPTVTTIHGESRLGGRTRLYEWLQWRTYQRFNAVIAVSTGLGEAAVRRVYKASVYILFAMRGQVE